MKKPLIILVAVIVFMFVGYYFTFLTPSAVMRNKTEKVLQQLSATVESQDRAKVAEALTQFFTDDAKIHLDVTFSSISASNLRPISQDFDRAIFLQFIDNVLYTLTDYHAPLSLTDFALTDNVAKVQFKSVPRADGPSFFSGVTLQVHFSGDVQCSGEVTFEHEQAKFKTMHCNVLLRSMAKGDSAADMVDKAQQIHDMVLPTQNAPQP
jgi:hypothetical protein